MKSRRRNRNKRSTRRQRGGKRMAGHVNPHIYSDEYQMVMHMMGQAAAEQSGYPRFLKMKDIFAYLANSEEVLKNKRFRQIIRDKINELYGEDKDYINNDREFADMIQIILEQINDLDTRNVRHQIPN